MRIRDLVHRDTYPDSYYAATTETSITKTSKISGDQLKTSKWQEAPHRLEGNIEAEVCVIGAGFTGLNTAINLAEAGLKVVVVEQNQIGWGASGRNGGQLIGGFGLSFPSEGRLAKQFTPQEQRLLWDWGIECVDIVLDRINRFSIDCDLTMGFYDAAHTMRGLDDLKRDFDRYKSYGYRHDLKLVEGSQAREIVNTNLYVGGLVNEGWGHLHPLKLALGEASAARSLGVRIYEDTRVEKIHREKKIKISTDSGSIHADKVVVATNGYLGDLLGKVGEKSVPVGSYIMATEPLGLLANDLFPRNVAVSDQRMVLDYYRLSSDRRLLFGGLATYSGKHPTSIKKALFPGMIDVFPQLKSIAIDYEWGGYLRVGANRVPQLGAIDNSIFYAMAYAGHGLAPSHMAAKLVSEAVMGNTDNFNVLAKVRHRSLPGGILRQPLFALAMVWYKMRDHFQ